MKKKTKISVAVITYNQQDTIGQTIESILTQKGEFDLELVIGEDCGSDKTHEICEDYVRQVESGKWKVEGYERTVVLLPNTKNLGIMANFARVIQACTGEYIGDIAGDDYYCDDHALEKQMQYMQTHPDVGVMAANGYSYYIKRNQYVPGLNPVFESKQDAIKNYYFSPLHLEGVCLAPVGMMYRALLFKKYIDLEEILRRHLPVEDFPIQAILSQHTRFACLPDFLVTYRVYRESATFISYNNPKYLSYYRGLVDTRRYLNELFPEDAVPENTLKELLFYKEFMLYMHQLDYKKAKRLIADVSEEIPNSGKLIQAKCLSKTWLHFIVAHYIKEYNYRKDLNKRT